MVSVASSRERVSPRQRTRNIHETNSDIIARFYVNVYTKKSQWEKPTEPVFPADDTPGAPPPSYEPGSGAPVATDTKKNPYEDRSNIENNPSGSGPSNAGPSGAPDDAKLAAQLQAEEDAKARGSTPSGATSSSSFPEELPARDGQQSRGLFSKLLGKKKPNNNTYPQQSYQQQPNYGGGYQQQQQQPQYGGYPQQGPPGGYYGQPQYGGYPQQQPYYPPQGPPGGYGQPYGGGYNQGYQQQQQQQRPSRMGGGGMGMGGVALGAGAGLLGGALLAGAFEHEQHEAYEDGYRKFSLFHDS